MIVLHESARGLKIADYSLVCQNAAHIWGDTQVLATSLQGRGRQVIYRRKRSAVSAFSTVHGARYSECDFLYLEFYSATSGNDHSSGNTQC